MIDIRDPEHLAATRAFADTLGPTARVSLEERLHRYEDDHTKLVVITKERMAPHSFYIEVYHIERHRCEPIDERTVVWHEQRRLWYNGGIIFDDSSKTWNIHT